MDTKENKILSVPSLRRGAWNDTGGSNNIAMNKKHNMNQKHMHVSFNCLLFQSISRIFKCKLKKNLAGWLFVKYNHSF